ncbi:FPD1 benzoylformate decarboxylase [Pyrenophora seminiperda CCB06]|uniref:FPD1 benzoylformate decarboxylase n=1 Tax=Pyrenophora seminiperda CCB06 TaxID=1302712 RepID=A0A3M7M157_9PLEO|nr:FPD1 benzoylformate decarboxylase [Pyrenophora seminiperda CCB06]
MAIPPKADDFTPLSEHQEQTPTSFFSAKPVLHAHYEATTLFTHDDHLKKDPIFSKFSSRREGVEDFVDNVDVWVTSEALVLFQTSPSPVGVSIPYPCLALHATMRYKSTYEALYINVSLNDAEMVNDDDDILLLDIGILPPSYTTKPTDTCIAEFFNALNTCADAYPDDVYGSDDDGEDVLDDTAPGASGWITAENMDEFMNENGNFSGMVIGDELGPGAGTVRAREDGDESVSGANGADGHEGKYYRTG